MVQCILKSKVLFIGRVGWVYTHVKLDKGIVISDISRKKAKKIIEENELSLADKADFHEDLNLGKIYVDKNFKKVLTNDIKSKNLIIELLAKLDSDLITNN